MSARRETERDPSALRKQPAPVDAPRACTDTPCPSFLAGRTARSCRRAGRTARPSSCWPHVVRVHTATGTFRLRGASETNANPEGARRGGLRPRGRRELAVSSRTKRNALRFVSRGGRTVARVVAGALDEHLLGQEARSGDRRLAQIVEVEGHGAPAESDVVDERGAARDRHALRGSELAVLLRRSRSRLFPPVRGGEIGEVEQPCRDPPSRASGSRRLPARREPEVVVVLRRVDEDGVGEAGRTSAKTASGSASSTCRPRASRMNASFVDRTTGPPESATLFSSSDAPSRAAPDTARTTATAGRTRRTRM